MVAMQKFSLVVSLMELTSAPLQPAKYVKSGTHIINTPVHCTQNTVFKSTVTNMMMMKQTFDATFNRIGTNYFFPALL
jgi:hypothetical protein